MTSGLLSAELSAACNSLGFWSGGSYTKNIYCKETIIDFIRFLRSDTDRAVRKHLGQAKILQTDLIPILIEHSEDEDLFYVLLRLLLILTSPVLMVYEEELPQERDKRCEFLEILSHLQSYKEAFTKKEVWEVLTSKLEKLLEIPYEDRDEDHTKTIERILILVRNVLEVPVDEAAENRPDNDANIHDQVLWCMHQSGMVDLLLFISSTRQEQQFYLHVLEVTVLMLREQTPKSLAEATVERSVDEKERDEKELLDIRRKEKLEKESKMKKYASARHSRFGGTFVVDGVKSISENDVIFHKPLAKAMSQSSLFEKQRARIPKNKQAMKDNKPKRRSPFSVRLFLKNYSIEFLNGAYNTLMRKVRENLVRGKNNKDDEKYYFWAMSFFMQFNRLYNFQVKLISETMDQEIFHFLYTRMETWLEEMVTDKKHTAEYSRKIHSGLKAYQELLMTLQYMLACSDSSVQKSAVTIERKVFYQSEYRELIIHLYNVFTPIKFSRLYLKDLVETTHLVLKMLERFSKIHKTMIVQGKPVKKTSKKKKQSKKTAPVKVNLDSAWEKIGPELSALLVTDIEIPLDEIPFLSGSPMEEEKIKFMKSIKAELMAGNLEKSIGMIREARIYWPENNSFGQADMGPDEEFLVMREIFFTDLGELPEAAIPSDNTTDEEADDEESEAQNIEIPDTVFKFTDFLGRFACPKVLSAASMLLETFESNTDETNHCIVSLFYRVAYDLRLPQMLFQASLFRTFRRALDSKDARYWEIHALAGYIMKRFCCLKEGNRRICLELLFWKSKKEAYEIENGYGSAEINAHSAKNVWTEEQEDELRHLAAEYEEPPAKEEPDAVSWIMQNMINKSRSRRAVVKKLKELYLFVGNMKPRSKKLKEMSEDEVNELRGLFEFYKENQDPMNCILGRLSVPRSRKVISDKLIELGLITDKTQLRKKRTAGGKSKQTGKKGKEWGERSDDESIYDSWSEEEDPEAVLRRKETERVRAAPLLPQIFVVLKKAVELGDVVKMPFDWLITELGEFLKDLPDTEDEDSQNEGMALVPISDPIIHAFENIPILQQVLHILSFEKPKDQVKYWRIPGTWKEKEIGERIMWLNNALNGDLPDTSQDLEEEVISLNTEDRTYVQPNVSDRNLKSTSNNSPYLKRTRNIVDYSSSSEEDLDNSKPGPSLPKSLSKKGKYKNDSDKENHQQSKIIDANMTDTSENGSIKTNRKKRFMRFESDSEEEESRKARISNDSNLVENNADFVKNSDSEPVVSSPFEMKSENSKLKRKRQNNVIYSDDDSNIIVEKETAEDSKRPKIQVDAHPSNKHEVELSKGLVKEVPRMDVENVTPARSILDEIFDPAQNFSSQDYSPRQDVSPLQDDSPNFVSTQSDDFEGCPQRDYLEDAMLASCANDPNLVENNADFVKNSDSEPVVSSPFEMKSENSKLKRKRQNNVIYSDDDSNIIVEKETAEDSKRPKIQVDAHPSNKHEVELSKGLVKEVPRMDVENVTPARSILDEIFDPAQNYSSQDYSPRQDVSPLQDDSPNFVSTQSDDFEGCPQRDYLEDAMLASCANDPNLVENNADFVKNSDSEPVVSSPFEMKSENSKLKRKRQNNVIYSDDDSNIIIEKETAEDSKRPKIQVDAHPSNKHEVELSKGLVKEVPRMDVENVTPARSILDEIFDPAQNFSSQDYSPRQDVSPLQDDSPNFVSTQSDDFEGCPQRDYLEDAMLAHCHHDSENSSIHVSDQETQQELSQTIVLTDSTQDDVLSIRQSSQTTEESDEVQIVYDAKLDS
ncbi:protein timeless homolog [Macrosteles quadrilineatus]|uniref:protein timeless homolog n=1 Tax=Macrosteles quadrilineatus TaxID=74068 RepID=UPI0023E2EF38|nr:protein timeless homolog [Macrosteles quadrilineatus]